MLPKPLQIALFFTLAFSSLSFTEAFAQDPAGIHPEAFDRDFESLGDDFPTAPGDNTYKPVPRPVEGDSLLGKSNLKPVRTPMIPVKSQQKPKSGGDDSILSFNFLYYIIQKYKLQDIVD